jgi:hypothetical protein
MAESLDQFVRRRATNRCEYCRLPEAASRLRHVLDHIIARQHRGGTVSEDLALCCGRCNQYKSPNIAGIDPVSKARVPLFDPRTQVWAEHFHYDGALLAGLTPVGRATVEVLALAINLPIRVAARRSLIETGTTF